MCGADTMLPFSLLSFHIPSQAVFWGNDVDANGESPVFYEGELEGFSFIRWANHDACVNLYGVGTLVSNHIWPRQFS